MNSPRGLTPDDTALDWTKASLGELSESILGSYRSPFDIALDSITHASSKTHDSETALIECAKAAPEAFGRLFELNYEKVLNYIYRCTLNLSIAEELTSNTFFKAFCAMGSYRHRGHFSAWIFSIATNEIRMHWRKESRKPKIASLQFEGSESGRVCFDVPAGAIEESVGEKMAQCLLLHRLLGQLPERQRSVIVLRYYENLSLEGIAEVLGMRIGTVKSLQHRAVKHLRIIIERDATFHDLRHFSL